MTAECPSCHAANDPGHRFCARCGSVLAPTPVCRACGVALADGTRFCTECGTSVAATRAEGPGAVVDGAWFRAPGVMARRVSPSQMRGAFKTLLPGFDLDALLAGTLLGKALDTVLARTVRVPFGSIGAVLRDGACVRVLPPGEQTTAGLLRELPDIARERTALFLVDRRPIPIVFPIERPSAGALETIHVQLLVSVGTRPEALAAFVNEVVGDRDAVGAEELHGRFRGEAERIVREALDGGGGEREARRVLEARFGARTGLSFELTFSPRHTVHRLDVRLGGALPPAAACAACGHDMRASQRFCIRCGAARAAVSDGDALLTADGLAAELDLALTVSGERPAPPTEPLRRAAARHLRGRPWAEISSADGFSALQTELADAARAALPGRALLTVDLLDARTASGEWALGARAEMARATEQARVGREWLAVAGEERALEEATLAAVLEEQRVHRDFGFAGRAAQLEDARRHAALQTAERALARDAAEADHVDVTAEDQRRRDRERDAARHRLGLDSERVRRRVEDEAHAERLRREARLDELRAMSALDGEVAEREQRHRLEAMARMEGKSEAQILAMQATQLAGAEHGGAFAEALGKLADGEAARRERERADARIDAKDERVTRLMEKVVGAQADARARGCPHCGAESGAVERFCGVCGKSRN